MPGVPSVQILLRLVSAGLAAVLTHHVDNLCARHVLSIHACLQMVMTSGIRWPGEGLESMKSYLLLGLGKIGVSCCFIVISCLLDAFQLQSTIVADQRLRHVSC